MNRKLRPVEAGCQISEDDFNINTHFLTCNYESASEAIIISFNKDKNHKEKDILERKKRVKQKMNNTKNSLRIPWGKTRDLYY